MKNDAIIYALNNELYSPRPDTYIKNVRSFEQSLSSEDLNDSLIQKRIGETKRNLDNLKNGRLYRGVDIGWVLSFAKEMNDGIANYSNSLSFAKGYSDIILEFEYHFSPERVIMESITDRKDTVSDYDKDIQQIKKDGYAWFIGDGLFHLRLKNSRVKLKMVHYCSDNLKENIASMVLLNRSHAGLSQVQLATLLNTKQPKIAQYEHAERMPDIDRIIELAQFLPFPQQIQHKSKNLILN